MDFTQKNHRYTVHQIKLYSDKRLQGKINLSLTEESLLIRLLTVTVVVCKLVSWENRVASEPKHRSDRD